MYDILKVIFGAIVVGDFLLAFGFFALWRSGRKRVPPPLAETKDTDD